MEIGKIRRVAVIGAGLMGHGIAQEFAAADYAVSLFDMNEAMLQTARQRIQDNLKRLAEQGLMGTESIERALGHLRLCTALEETVRDADFVIEAVTEDLTVKQALFEQLDALCPPHTILASNTSTFMPSRLAAATRRPEQVLVAHYFNPPYLLPLVEVVRNPQTSEATVQTVCDLLTGIGKTPVVLQKEAPGFVANRLQTALLREALHIVQNGIASPQEVDTVVRNSFGRRLALAGPFEIGDLAGLDLWRTIAELLLPEIASTTEVPSLLEAQVARGEYGVKTGKGFYTWDTETVQAERGRIARGLLEMSRWDTAAQPTEQPEKAARQRLLYLHASHPSIRSRVIAAALHEPVPDSVTQIDPLAPEIPYNSVFEAILDGWRVIHFPDQRAPFDDREIDIVGYEFILEKMEVPNAR